MRNPPAHIAAATALLLGSIGFASRSSGDTPLPPVAIRYSAPATCPPGLSFLDEIRRRTSRVSVYESQADPSDIAVAITATKDRFVGALERRAADGSSATRSLEAASCEEVASALALVVALALDPDADTSASPAPKESSSAPPPSDPPPPAAPAESVTRTTEPPREPRVEPARPRAPEPERARARFGAGAWLNSDVYTFVPDAFGPGLSLEVAWRGGAASWGPALRLSGYYASRTYEDDVAGAKLRWYGARLDLCSFFLRKGVIEAAPCVQLGSGFLSAEGIVDDPKQSTALWADLGLAARSRVVIAEWITLEHQMVLVAPLTRHTLEFVESDHVLYKVPAIGLRSIFGVTGWIP